MDTPRRYRQDSRLPCQEIEGQTVVVVPAKNELHVLDDVGTFLWTQLSRFCSAEELTQTLCEEFDVDPDQAKRDVDAFLETLLGKELVILE